MSIHSGIYSQAKSVVSTIVGTNVRGTIVKNRTLLFSVFLTFVLLIVSAFVPTEAMADPSNQTFTYPTAVSLGSVDKYAVFAKTYNQKAHMEGTVAAQTRTGQDKFGPSLNVKNFVDPNEAFCYLENNVISSNFHPDNENAQNFPFKYYLILPNGINFDYTYNNNSGLQITQESTGGTAAILNKRPGLCWLLYHFHCKIPYRFRYCIR